MLLHEGNRVVAPTALQGRAMGWCHHALAHPGNNRMGQSAKLACAWEGARRGAQNCCGPCGKCQRCKPNREREHGLLPGGAGGAAKWPRANVGLWGPEPVKNINGHTHELHLVAMVGPVAGWFGMGQLRGSPTAKRCQGALGNAWLARHPRPKGIGFGNGGGHCSLLREGAWQGDQRDPFGHCSLFAGSGAQVA